MFLDDELAERGEGEGKSELGLVSVIPASESPRH